MTSDEERAGRGVVERVIGAALLNTDVYEEVEADPGATGQAAAVVVIAAVAGGIGALTSDDGGIVGLIVLIAVGLANWVLWAGITYWVGTTLFRTPDTSADWGELARTTGFAQSPGVLRVLGLIPTVGQVIVVVVSVWQLVAMVIAVRQALDYTSTWRTIGVVLVGFIPMIILWGVVSAIFL